MISQIKHEKEAHRVSEEGSCQTPKPFLSCSVPKLQLNTLTASLENIEYLHTTTRYNFFYQFFYCLILLTSPSHLFLTKIYTNCANKSKKIEIKNYSEI